VGLDEEALVVDLGVVERRIDLAIGADAEAGAEAELDVPGRLGLLVLLALDRLAAAERQLDVQAGHELGPGADQRAIVVLVVLHPGVDEQELDADQGAVDPAAGGVLEGLVLAVAGDPGAAGATAVDLGTHTQDVSRRGARQRHHDRGDQPRTKLHGRPLYSEPPPAVACGASRGTWPAAVAVS
jgi:hypothetical protein